MKRVAVVRQYFYPLDPRVAREVSALRDAGYAVDLLCLRRDGEPAHEVDGPVRVRRLGLRKHRGGPVGQLVSYALFFLWVAALLAIRHVRTRYDVVQVNTLPDFLVFAAAVPKLLGATVVLDLHECMPEFFAVKYDMAMDHRLVRAVAATEQAAVRFADHVITCTPLMKDAFVGRGADPDVITVVQNSANEDIFVRERFPGRLGSGRFRVLCHGSIEPLYGIDIGVRAVALLADDLPELELRVVGEGSQRPLLVALARDLGIADRVSFSDGFLPMDELVQEIADADAGLVAMQRNPFRDLTLCNKMFDYVSMGVPALVSRTRSVEQVYDERDFLLFHSDDPADLATQILRLARTPGLGADLAAHAETTTEPLRWPHQRRVYLDVIRDAQPGPTAGQSTNGAASPDGAGRDAVAAGRWNPTPPPTVSVTIATYNRGHMLAEVLAPLLDDPATHEVVVVVDGSTDNSMALLGELAARDPRVVGVWQDNAGTAAARAAAVSRATGEVVLFLDDDVIAERGLVSGHAARHVGRRGQAVVGFMPTRVPERRKAGQFTTHLYAADYLDHVAGWERAPATVITSLWQGNVSLPRRDALALYRSEPLLPRGAFHEDREFGLAAKQLGLEAVFVRDLLATHHHERNLDAFRRQARSQGQNTVALHREWEDLIGPLRPTAWIDDLPAGLRLPVRVLRHGRTGGVVRECLAGLVRAAGVARLLSLEMVAARLLRRLEAQAGADLALTASARAGRRHTTAAART